MTDDVDSNQNDDQDPVSGWQVFYDDPGMLTFLGITSPAVLYIIWGVMEIVSVPIAGY